MEKIKTLFAKYKEIISYIFFGVLTTLVNWISYIVLVRLLGGAESASAVSIATAIAQILSIVFAYVTNRKWVFESKEHGFVPVAKEMFRFFLARAFSAVVDVALMYVGVSLLHINDTFMKLVSNVVIVVLNYIFSKLLVFRKKG